MLRCMAPTRSAHPTPRASARSTIFWRARLAALSKKGWNRRRDSTAAVETRRPRLDLVCPEIQ